MRWRIERVLGYGSTHAFALTNTRGGPICDLIFATDHPVGDKIMNDVYRKAAAAFPRTRKLAQARRRDRDEAKLGLDALFTHEELSTGAPEISDDPYRHSPPVPPYGLSEAE